MIVTRALTRHVKPQAVRNTVAKALSKHQACSCVPFTSNHRQSLASSNCQYHGATNNGLTTRWFSSSRFSDLVEGEEDKKKKQEEEEEQEASSGSDSDSDGDDGDLEDDNGEEGDEDDVEEGEEDEEAKNPDEEMWWSDPNYGGVALDEDVPDEIMELFMSDPIKWNVDRLARRFEWSVKRVEATIFLQGLEADMSIDELKENIQQSMQAAKEQHARMANERERRAEGKQSGEDQEAQEADQVQGEDQGQEGEEDDDSVDNDGAHLSEEEIAELRGELIEVYRNPDFFFLNDEYRGYPPLARRLGKHQKTDKLSFKEAKALQAFASKHEIKLHKSFAKDFGNTKNRWKIAVRDTSRPQYPIVMREHDGKLRFAKGEELKVRSWVKRDPYFNGLGLDE